METYTIEDIELLRQKSGLSYQEAVALLDYHNGSIARALIDLEKHGRLNVEKNQEKEGMNEMNQKKQQTGKDESKNKAMNIIQKLYRSRVKIRKGETTIINVSVLFAILSLLPFAWPITIIGVVASVLLGYQFSFSSMDPDFESDNLEKMVKNAAQNAKSSVSSVVKTIATEEKKKENAVREQKNEKDDSDNQETGKSEMQELKIEVDKQENHKASGNDEQIFPEEMQSLRDQARELEETMDSFFENNASANTYHSAYSAAASGVPTIQVPVQAETRDGDISTEDDRDGYSTITIG